MIATHATHPASGNVDLNPVNAKKMVLIADTSEHTRYRLARIFQKAGYRVAVAGDADEAAATAAVLSVDLLIADIDLPGVVANGIRGGAALLRAMQQQADQAGRGKRIAGVALAAKGSARAADATAVQAFDQCLSKPASEADLKAAVLRALSQPGESRRCA